MKNDAPPPYLLGTSNIEQFYEVLSDLPVSIYKKDFCFCFDKSIKRII